ncbi:MAG: ABC transporter substrate-binding protein [Desulfurococcaceae archaeon]|nr:ABC transporter substrate-binding protein [Desulfurococcaceae archaeon]
MRATQTLAIAMVLVATATFFTGYYVAPTKTVTTTQTVAYTVTTTTTFTQAITPIVTPSTLTVTQTVVREVSRREVKYPITIVDSAGRAVTIEKEPQRVVVIASTQAMVLSALGVGGKVVGAPDTATNNPVLMSILQKQGAREVINIGSFSSPSLEAILSANPDLVIFYASFYRNVYDSIASRLPPNVKVVYFDLYILRTMFDEIYKLGLIFNRVDRALELISKWTSRLTYITSKAMEIRPSDKAKTFFETYTDLATAGPGSGWYLVPAIAGGINVFGDVTQPYPKVSPEAVIERNPDVIIKVVSSTRYDPCRMNSTKPLEETYNTIVSRPGWSTISAVRNNKVYVYTTAYLDGPGYVIQVALVAKLLYPDVFKDVDVQRWIYEWLKDIGLENPEQICKLPWAYPPTPGK